VRRAREDAASSTEGAPMVSAELYMLVFRAIHILAAISWGGSLFLLVLYLQPSARAIGPAAGPFMAELVGKRKLTSVLLGLAFTTIIAGGFLYWHDMEAVYGGFSNFTDSAFGGTLTFGALCAIAAMLLGVVATKPTMDRMMATSARIAQGGGPPAPELAAELQGLQARARRLAIVNLVLVALAAFAMSTARYW
jgi:uncharacterized membrane protein